MEINRALEELSLDSKITLVRNRRGHYQIGDQKFAPSQMDFGQISEVTRIYMIDKGLEVAREEYLHRLSRGYSDMPPVRINVYDCGEEKFEVEIKWID